MKNISNNKGFTLVELLAVMVILISVSLVAVTGIISSLERRDAKEVDEQIELAVGAAKIYFSLEGGTCVKVQTLVDGDYFSSEDKISELNRNYYIKFTGSGYSYVTSCS